MNIAILRGWRDKAESDKDFWFAQHRDAEGQSLQDFNDYGWLYIQTKAYQHKLEQIIARREGSADPIPRAEESPAPMTSESLRLQTLETGLRDVRAYLEPIDMPALAALGARETANAVGKVRVMLDSLVAPQAEETHA